MNFFQRCIQIGRQGAAMRPASALSSFSGIVGLKARLATVCFLEFAVWGAYLTSMGNYLGNAGMGDLIAWFFAIQGLVCLFMPGLMGLVGDRYMEPQRLLGVCHLGAALCMALCWYQGITSALPPRGFFLVSYTISTALFMPTVALSNSVAFRLMRARGLDTVKHFPQIRVFGTVGFIAAMLFVNFGYIQDGHFGFSATVPYRFQFTAWQFFVSAVLGLALFLFTFLLPRIPVAAGKKDESLRQRLGLDALGIFKRRHICVFFIFSILAGMCLKVTNAYAAPFITSFMGQPEYAGNFGAANANLLTSVSQLSEALCILLIPFFMKRFGVKPVLAIAIFAWAVRFGTFALGNPGSGLWLLLLSMVVYGIAFDFFNIAGAIFIERSTPGAMTASVQGLWMMSTMGIGASVGTLAAGAVIDSFCHWGPSAVMPGMVFLSGNWSAAWGIFSLFALVVAVAFCLLFRIPSDSKQGL